MLPVFRGIPLILFQFKSDFHVPGTKSPGKPGGIIDASQPRIVVGCGKSLVEENQSPGTPLHHIPLMHDSRIGRGNGQGP